MRAPFSHVFSLFLHISSLHGLPFIDLFRCIRARAATYMLILDKDINMMSYREGGRKSLFC